MYLFELLTSETIKLRWSTKSKITNYKNDKQVPHLKISEVVLIYCNIVNNSYQQDLRVFYAFVHNKLFGQLLDILSTNFVFLKTFDLKFLKIEVWFSDTNSKPLEIEDETNITLVVN